MAGDQFAINILDKKPYLGDDTDLLKLLENFMSLSQQRHAAFSGLGALDSGWARAIYDEEGWAEGDMTFGEFTSVMLELDATMRQVQAERGPTGK